MRPIRLTFVVLSGLVFFLFVGSGFAQPSTTGTITTYAGRFVPVNGAQAVTQAIDPIEAVISDGAGGIYFSTSVQFQEGGGVFHVARDGTLMVIAGVGVSGFSGDGGPAASAQLDGPTGLTLDSAGNLFIVDRGNRRIRKVSAGGIISTVASFGTRFPEAVAVDAAGNVLVAMRDAVVRKVSPAGVITTFAGTETPGFSGDGGPATAADINYPGGIVIDAAGNVFIADRSNHRIRRVSPNGIITTIAGNGAPGGTQGAFSGDGGPAISAEFNLPSGIARDAAGNLFIADSRNHRIRKIGLDGIITTVAGTAGGFGGDGGPATSAQINRPVGVAVDAAGNLFIADRFNQRIRKVSPDGIITTIAGNGTSKFSGDGGPATMARLTVEDVAVDPAGNVFIADSVNDRIRKISPDGIVTTAVGTETPGFTGDGGPATAAQLESPSALTFDAAGNLFIAANLRIRKVSTDGVIHTVAGNGTRGFGGVGGPATSAQLAHPSGLAVDPLGNLFIADSGNGRVYKVDAAGIITSVAGGGNGGIGDGGPATAVQFLIGPMDVAVDAAGNLFIADYFNSRIRKVSPDGIITTVAGSTRGFSGDGGPATSAQLSLPRGVEVDAGGNIFIADFFNSRIRKVSPDGIITTVAGTGGANGVGSGFAGDGGPAASAELDHPVDVALDSAGNLFIADSANDRIRKVTFAQGFSYSMTDNGAASVRSAGTSQVIAPGYARIQATPGSSTPSGVAIYSYRPGSYLISETGVPATSPSSSGRIYAEVKGTVNTGLAIANPNDQPATINFFYTDTGGNDLGSGTTTVPANTKIAKFLDAAPFKTFDNTTFQGTFSFTSSVPVAALAMRSLVNDRGDFLMSTLPVVEPAATANTANAVIPHFADGEGWTTQILLVNPTSNVLTGSVEFRNDSGAIVNVPMAAQPGAAYSIAPRSSYRLATTGTASTTTTGSVRILPTRSSPSNAVAPTPLVVFSYSPGTTTVTEAAVASASGTAFRMYAESSGNIQAGIGVTNNSASPASIRFELFNLDGSTTGLPLPATLNLNAFGHTGKFLPDIFENQTLTNPFKGLVRISTASSPGISVVALRTNYNERGDFLIATTPVADEMAPANSAELVFPLLVDGGGYTTQFILFSRQGGQSSSGSMNLYSDSGGMLNLLLR